ncbi:MAG: DUF1501 domain-containing protein [Gammaproteobacteria bacterium]|nr:DUF1501 domain-containing protein [Gammaproteobacteria bacterium]
MDKQRRRFLRYAAAGGLAYAFGRTPGTVQAQVAGTGGFGDYKALVCLFLFGGNDSWNMFVPTSTAEYNAYARSRGAGTSSSLAIDASALLPATTATPPANGVTYGFHPSMGDMRDLFNQGHAAVLANVGPLIRPTTKLQYQTPGHELPPQLFSHNDQQDQWHSLRGKAILKSGWGGRVADVLAAQTAGQQLSLNVSLSGQTFFQAGEQARPYVMGATGAAAFSAFSANALGAQRRAAFEAIAGASYGTVYERGFAGVQQRAVQYADRVNAALAGSRSFTALPDSGTTLSPLATQLRTVAKMISARGTLAMSRQVFFVSTGGFDTHDDQVADQPGLLGNVANSMKLFYDALAEMGMQDSVTLFTHSDFGRTLTSNGDGADHAWGGVQLVVGGAVRGATVYGQYPVLEIGNDLDVGGGRFIPTTSADQYAATLARWFGVSDAQLPTVAPSINNFAVRDLGFLA